MTTTYTNSKTNEHLNENQFFTFMLANEEYGIDILSVLEIRGLERMTAIPSAPHFVKGVINLRGNIIPVIDLRERFNLESVPYNRSNVLIVVQVNTDHKKDIGVIVDAVSDVYSINPKDIQPKPEICNTVGHEYISGLVTVHLKDQDKLVILLDVDKLLSLDDLHTLSTVKASYEEN